MLTMSDDDNDTRQAYTWPSVGWAKEEIMKKRENVLVS